MTAFRGLPVFKKTNIFCLVFFFKYQSAGAMLNFSIAYALDKVNTGWRCHALCNGVGLGRIQPFIEAQCTYLQAKPSHCNKNTYS
jgi:hypothetical protein